MILAHGYEKRFPFEEVQCCGECNTLLGARPLWTVALRKRFIKGALRRRYRKYLNMPEWTDGELGRLTGHLQSYIMGSVIMREIVQARLAW